MRRPQRNFVEISSQQQTSATRRVNHKHFQSTSGSLDSPTKNLQRRAKQPNLFRAPSQTQMLRAARDAKLVVQLHTLMFLKTLTLREALMKPLLATWRQRPISSRSSRLLLRKVSSTSTKSETILSKIKVANPRLMLATNLIMFMWCMVPLRNAKKQNSFTIQSNLASQTATVEDNCTLVQQNINKIGLLTC